MSGLNDASLGECPSASDPAMQGEYATLSQLLLEFITISEIEKAWVVKSDNGKISKAIFSASQAKVQANKRRKFLLTAIIPDSASNPSTFQWSPFPADMTSVSIILPSPSGSKLLIVRNPENDSPTKFEIWGPSDLVNEFLIPQSVHGSLYADAWFEGVSWNHDETLVAYVAEEPSPPKPTFNSVGHGSYSATSGWNEWKGQGEWEDGWGETYMNKRQPKVFVFDINSGKVCAAEGIERMLSIGQVVWAPLTDGSLQYLIVVGWSGEPRKLGMKYCTNRHSALYAVTCPFSETEAKKSEYKCASIHNVVKLTQGINSAFYPCFSPNGKFLMFFSAKCAVKSSAHNATFSLHRVDWPNDGKPKESLKVNNVVPVVMTVEDGCFPGLYFPSSLKNPWLSDGCTMVMSSIWGSTRVILSVDVVSGAVSRITPHDAGFSWDVLSLNEDRIIAVCSSPVDVPKIKYGHLLEERNRSDTWNWEDISSPLFRCSEEVSSRLSSLQFQIMKIPVRISSETCNGAVKSFEVIYVSSSTKKTTCNPLVVVSHGGPHDVSTSTFSKTLAFLASIGYNLLMVNYRGSIGFGEEALQSLPGNVGIQDVNDVLTAIDHVISLKLAEPPRIAVLGGSHGGFLSTHLTGQAPDKISVAAVSNPVCNLALMVGTTDIPEWCFVNAFGPKGKTYFTEAPSMDHLNVLYDKSPISHVHKVKAPTLFLLGGQDRRVPIPDGLQYARALRERGVDTKILMFPDDVHEISRPQSEFESFLNVAMWFKKYCP